MIFFTNVVCAVLGGVYIFYVCSLWILLFFNKGKLVTKLAGDDDSFYILSFFNLLVIMCSVVDVSYVPAPGDFTAVSVLLLSSTCLCVSLILVGFFGIILSGLRSTFIDT